MGTGLIESSLHRRPQRLDQTFRHPSTLVRERSDARESVHAHGSEDGATAGEFDRLYECGGRVAVAR